MTKVQPPVAPGGMFTKDAFDIDLQAQTVTCPDGITVPIRPVRGDKKLNGKAEFGMHCRACPLADMCTTSKSGRRISISRHEARLAAAVNRQSCVGLSTRPRRRSAASAAINVGVRSRRTSVRCPAQPPGMTPGHPRRGAHRGLSNRFGVILNAAVERGQYKGRPTRHPPA
jgi:hypothetical protein